MSELVQLQLAGTVHNNQRLFSDHYLNYILPRHWEPLKDEAAQVMAQLQQLYTGFTPNASNEAQVDQTLRPVLDAAIQNAQTDAERIQAVLAINALDPAMGSGHFLVEVTEYIARYLVELGVQPEPVEGASGNGNGRSAATGEADLTYWKRRVAQQCIYGVDLNLLAVELAKLSLWLITAARDRPLSFLDHHLRHGNALPGSWLKEIAAGQHPQSKQAQKRAQEAQEAEAAEKEAGQLTLPLLDDEFRRNTSSALDSIAAIEHNPGVTLKDVKAQEAAYAELKQRFSEKYLQLANLGSALYHDLEVGSDIWRPLTDYALGRASELAQTSQFKNWLDAATALASAQAKLNQKLQMWWALPFKEFRAEVTKVFKRDIPLKERDDWEKLLRDRTAGIQRLTDEIVRLETELNAAVYDVFGLNKEERALIEQETKYGYGEW